MKIGIIVSSLTQSIPYMTYLVSHGYEVIPIIFQKEINENTEENSHLKNIIENITKNKIIKANSFPNESKLDTLIILKNKDDIYSFQSIYYGIILKEHAPIIITNQACEDIPFEIQANHSIHFINYPAINIIDECNNVISTINKVLQKK